MADEMSVNRDIVIEADAESIERLRKEGHVRGFTVFCDEQQRVGGPRRGVDPQHRSGLLHHADDS